MNPLDIIDAIGDMDDDLIRLCFDEDDEISPVQEWTEICNHPPSLPKSKQQPLQGNSKPDDTSNSNKKVSGFFVLSHLLTAVCTAACIAGFTILIRSVHSPNDLYTPSGSSEVAVTQPTTVKTAATTVPITVSTVNTTTVTEQTTLETVLSTSEQPEMELLITAETTAQFEIEDITETELTDTVTETVSASTAEVTETTVQTTELEVQKPEPADDLNEKLKQIASGKGAGTVTLLDEMDGEQYGWYIVPDGDRSAIVYSEVPEVLDKVIAEDEALSHLTIIRTAYPEIGENCWKLSFISVHPNQLTDYMARCLLDVMKNAQCGTLLDIIIEDFKQPMVFETGNAYILPICISSVSSEKKLIEEYADVLDLEHSSAIVNFERKTVLDILNFMVSLSQGDIEEKDNYHIVFLRFKDTNDHQQLFEIAKKLEKRENVILFSSFFTNV